MEREVKFIQSGHHGGFILFSEGGDYPTKGQKVTIHTKSIHVNGTYESGYVSGLMRLPKDNEVVLIQWERII